MLILGCYIHNVLSGEYSIQNMSIATTMNIAVGDKNNTPS